ncbi:cAMP-dependent kinase regulatory subunit [Cryptosporidium sp. chipmunk genotype I]|uniref:cAMP-dependent kinase regulatory subunit n=1 Tax=Cryptosporidium sp. chipmunk genotype I TaxID=1280935 RepID=UPI00351AA7B8|nr:cAMP-dependent kinase regulatory subunit [Cryptosporidium sp. chipmunk genotype I]
MGFICPCASSVDAVHPERTSRKEDTRKKMSGTSSGSESESDGDDVRDNIEIPKNFLTRGPRTSVSAEAYGAWNKMKDFTPPSYPKTSEQEKRIREKLLESFMFTSLDDDELNTVVLACVETSVKKGTEIITQGDNGDKLYIIDQGTVECYKKTSTEPRKHLCDLNPGDAFGELALLYNCPRAASVVAKTDCLLWALDRETFNHIVKGSASKRISTYEAFLKEVEILKTMDVYELNKLTMVLKNSIFEDGQEIIKQGEQGDTFYLIITGNAVALKDNVEVMNYKRGDYFGELALLRNTPRAATVKAKGRCKVAYLDRKAFKRLLGPIEDILKRNTDKYKTVIKKITTKV